MNRHHVAGNHRIASGRAVLWIAVVLAAAGADASAQPPEGAPPGLMIGSDPTAILVELYKLESSRDPKCHSTASRFEGFICGTSLSVDARERRFDLQKELIRKLWIGASRRAATARQPFVSDVHVQPLVDRVLTQSAAESGEKLIKFQTGLEVAISPVREEQYASIAYALRAQLSVQQDFFMSGGDVPLTLEEGGVNALRQAVDAVTLSVLLTADQQARIDNQPQITAETLEKAWRLAVPADLSFDDEAFETKLVQESNEQMRTDGARIVLGIINQKMQSYAKYNAIDPAQRNALLIRNLRQFYARYPLSEDPQRNQQVVQAYQLTVQAFARRLIVEAAMNAERDHRTLIRAGDAEAAVETLIPQTIDDFEDIHVFTKLARDQRLTLEAYDCDSLRDFGFHWEWMYGALSKMPDVKQHLDPFSAEIIAEGISQYAVLLPRMAGMLARQRRDASELTLQHIELAVREIKKCAEDHHNAPERPDGDTKIVSTTSEAPITGDAYFTDVTDASGVTFIHRSCDWLNDFRRKWIGNVSKIDTGGIPTFSGGGIAAEDIDGDGDMDLLMLGGKGLALMLNDGSGNFTDATTESGLDLTNDLDTTSEARQPIIADFDNDGIQDVLITCVGEDHRLFRGVGEARFEDATSSAGLGGNGLIGGPATVFDFDNDGLLDVYIGYFGHYLQGAIPTLDRNNTNALPNRLFRNEGNLQFKDVTAGSGADDPGWTQALAHVDFDRDGLQDLIVANDFGRNAFLRNLGGGKFENLSPRFGIHAAYHSMNVGTTDLNRDGFPDVYISNIATLIKDSRYRLPNVNTPMKLDPKALGDMLVKESDMLYMSQSPDGELLAYQPSDNIERGTMSTGWAWDAEFLDFDNDGDDDLYVVNGANEYSVYFYMVQEETPDDTSVHHYVAHDREMNVFFVNQGGKLINRTVESGAGFAGNSRSTAYLDFDNDGDLDIAVNNFHAPATILRNNTGRPDRGWLSVRLIGDQAQGVNRDAIGARLELTGPDGLAVTREIQGGSGFLSMNPKTQHFGLGGAETVNLTVTWPNGDDQTFNDLQPDRAYTIQIGEDQPRVAGAPVVTNQE
ncbi:MAG: hypothetical protein CMJ49_12170 [Planctomycetaceae bacterium]|nr:hypothetical protein [Planctomycetaceae bacterium]